MGGDLFQWNEANYDNENLYRGLRGGGWFTSSSFVESSGRYYYGSPTGEFYYVGFRVASVPTGWVRPDPGDANGDGKVDINDLTIVLTNYDKTGMAWSQGEFTGGRHGGHQRPDDRAGQLRHDLRLDGNRRRAGAFFLSAVRPRCR